MRYFILFPIALTALACTHLASNRSPASDPIAGAVSGVVAGPVADAGTDDGLILNSWMEMNPDGGGIARVITSAVRCPVAMVNGQPIPMQVRATPSADSSFPQMVCETAVPVETEVVIGGTHMPIVPSSPQKIVVIGDTGCRIKVSSKSNKSKIQNCNESSGWPFAGLAAAAAAQKPDLVIHVGDYHYREAACPVGNKKCEGATHGDVWASWSEDFFIPAKPLLQAAPWIFVRGNHEICARAHEGYFRFLDPHAMPNGSCPDVVPPYAVHVGKVTLAVLDSSFADIDRAALQTVEAIGSGRVWLFTHRPPWVSAAAKAAGDGDEEVTSVQPDTSPAVGVPGNIGLVMTGHQHIFRATTYADHRPPQIIVGNGGTLLEKHPADEVVGTAIDSSSTTLASVTTSNQFGFLLLQNLKESRGSSSWSANVFGERGDQMTACEIKTHARSAAVLTCH